MPDFGLLSSKTVTEVLMLEMKMSPNAKTYLVSGYPRNMRDVVEYSEKIQIVQGVILISWRQKVLERQIDYGAKLGQVVLSLARMELNNFYKNVIPVAEYFDQSNMLISVSNRNLYMPIIQESNQCGLSMMLSRNWYKWQYRNCTTSITEKTYSVYVQHDGDNLLLIRLQRQWF
nr:unnamed protein product [Callosobruchus analis]